MKLVHLLVLSLLLLTHAQVYPSYFAYPDTSAVEVNGSSHSGHCSESSTRYFDNGDIGNYTCNYPPSSVLFDGNIPTLTGLDGDTWASQLLTLYKTDDTTKISLDFTDTPGYAGLGGMELAMFNCPEWGIAVENIELWGAETSRSFRIREVLASKKISNISSCDSLVRVCLTISPRSSQEPFFSLQFENGSPDMNWTYLAEITFHAIGSYCRADVIHTAIPTTSELKNHSEGTVTAFSEDVGPTPCPCEAAKCEVACPSPSSLATILGSSIPLTILAIMATVILTLSVVAVCKYRSKFKVRYSRTELAEEEEEEEEEEKGVDVKEGEEGMEMEHTYDEIPFHVLAHETRDIISKDTAREPCEGLRVEHKKDAASCGRDAELVRDGDESGEMAPYVFQGNNAYGVKLESIKHNAYENVMEFI